MRPLTQKWEADSSCVSCGSTCVPHRHPSCFRPLFRPRLARLGRIPGPTPLSSKCSLNDTRHDAGRTGLSRVHPTAHLGDLVASSSDVLLTPPVMIGCDHAGCTHVVGPRPALHVVGSIRRKSFNMHEGHGACLAHARHSAQSTGPRLGRDSDGMRRRGLGRGLLELVLPAGSAKIIVGSHSGGGVTGGDLNEALVVEAAGDDLNEVAGGASMPNLDRMRASCCCSLCAICASCCDCLSSLRSSSSIISSTLPSPLPICALTSASCALISATCALTSALSSSLTSST